MQTECLSIGEFHCDILLIVPPVTCGSSSYDFRVRPFDGIAFAPSSTTPTMMERVMTFTGSTAAAAFLRRFLPDPLAVRTIQTITARVCSDQRSLDQPEQWVERLAPHLASGMVLVIERTVLSPGQGSTEGKTSPRTTSPPPRRQSSPSDPAPDPATFSPYGVNEEAQAQILSNAAENGTPFCEECARV